MANYNETTIAGSEYQRCNGIRIVNPVGKTPSISFSEEKITILPDRSIETSLGELTIAYDAAKQIPVLDPVTGLATGELVTYEKVYQILYSAYLQLAIARDTTPPL